MRSIAPPPPSSQAVSVTEQLPARPATGPAPGIAGAVPVAGWATPGELAPLLYQNSNNSDEHPPDELPELTPYHQKSAFTLGENVRRFCDLYGLQNCGFLTLTFPDNVVDHKEASRRFNNMNRRYLGTFYGEWIWARERQKRGAWHYHLVVQCKGDIRTGFDWDEYRQWLTDYSQGKRRRLRTGNPLLRSLWEMNNRALPLRVRPCRAPPDPQDGRCCRLLRGQVHFQANRPTARGRQRRPFNGPFRRVRSRVPKVQLEQRGGQEMARKPRPFAIHACGCTDHDEFLEKAPQKWAYRYRKDIMSYHRHFAERYPEEAPF